jgi:hypothetical protein
VHVQLASEALHAWAEDNHIDAQAQLEDLGLRLTYFTSGPITETSAPYRDFAVPFA